MMASLDGNFATDFEGEGIMTSFAHADYPTQHPGVVRMQRAFANLQSLAAYVRDWLRSLALRHRS